MVMAQATSVSPRLPASMAAQMLVTSPTSMPVFAMPEAEKSLDAFSSKGDQMISPAAEAALGDAYAHLNKLDDAVSAFKKAASMADSKADDDTNNSLSPVFLIKAGEILESQNKKADALSIYQDVKKKYVNSMLVQSGEIDKYIERASN